MYAFASMKISSISLPNSLKEIGDYAFEDCYISSKIEIPNGVIKIGRGVFSNSYIKEIFIPDSVEEIDHNTFDLCWILENIWVGKNNRYYMDIDGELYLKDGKTLVKTPEGRLPDPSEIMASDAYNWGIMFQGIDEENQMDE